ncbi:hypothetical protein VTK26DRAFT_2213 [Humicola hyalothermophila]
MPTRLDEIRNVILLFSNPSWTGVGTISNTIIRNVTALTSHLAYSARFSGNTTVLSSRYAGTSNGVIQGLLYVPDLPYGDSCLDETSAHVPVSAARQANLPPTNYHMIAIAPWVSERCSSAYLAAARADPIRAFLFYMPGNSSTPPPPADAPEWHIQHDHGWMDQTGHPVYAVSGIVGQLMMQHLALYSGNMTEVPFGRNITERFRSDPEDYLRIWTELVIRTERTAFETWVYLLIVIGVLLVVIFTTSLIMHLVQAHRRASLRRRVIAGEVNLEAAGIKRLTVPAEHLQKLPLFTYHYEPSPPTTPPSSPRPSKSRWTHAGTCSPNRAGSMTAVRTSCPATVSGQGIRTMTRDYQPTCEICLEPYENRVTIIRELPCGHIFHPECIDEFLHKVSSLCPICKASMLPEGFCPEITNAMVRRERAIRRLRGRVNDPVIVDESHRAGRSASRWWTNFMNQISSGRKISPPSSTSTELRETRSRPTRSQQTERQPESARLQSQPANTGQDPDPSGTPAAVTRERMRELAGFEPDYGESRRSRWQQVRSRIFPGFD